VKDITSFGRPDGLAGAEARRGVHPDGMSSRGRTYPKDGEWREVQLPAHSSRSGLYVKGTGWAGGLLFDTENLRGQRRTRPAVLPIEDVGDGQEDAGRRSAGTGSPHRGQVASSIRERRRTIGSAWHEAWTIASGATGQTDGHMRRWFRGTYGRSGRDPDLGSV